MNDLKFLLAGITVLAMCFTMGVLTGYFCRPEMSVIASEDNCKAERTVSTDTVKYEAPHPVTETTTGMVKLKVAKEDIKAVDEVSDESNISDKSDILNIDIPGTTDSMTVKLPLEQKVYEGEEYRAWVSGIQPRLDSIAVYSRREIVTVRKPSKRWHIGLTAGYGFTGKGMQPYMGIGITYSLIAF